MGLKGGGRHKVSVFAADGSGDVVGSEWVDDPNVTALQEGGGWADADGRWHDLPKPKKKEKAKPAAQAPAAPAPAPAAPAIDPAALLQQHKAFSGYFTPTGEIAKPAPATTPEGKQREAANKKIEDAQKALQTAKAVAADPGSIGASPEQAALNAAIAERNAIKVPTDVVLSNILRGYSADYQSSAGLDAPAHGYVPLLKPKGKDMTPDEVKKLVQAVQDVNKKDPYWQNFEDFRTRSKAIKGGMLKENLDQFQQIGFLSRLAQVAPELIGPQAQQLVTNFRDKVTPEQMQKLQAEAAKAANMRQNVMIASVLASIAAGAAGGMAGAALNPAASGAAAAGSGGLAASVSGSLAGLGSALGPIGSGVAVGATTAAIPTLIQAAVTGDWNAQRILTQIGIGAATGGLGGWAGGAGGAAPGTAPGTTGGIAGTAGQVSPYIKALMSLMGPVMKGMGSTGTPNANPNIGQMQAQAQQMQAMEAYRAAYEKAMAAARGHQQSQMDAYRKMQADHERRIAEVRAKQGEVAAAAERRRLAIEAAQQRQAALRARPGGGTGGAAAQQPVDFSWWGDLQQQMGGQADQGGPDPWGDLWDWANEGQADPFLFPAATPDPENVESIHHLLPRQKRFGVSLKG